MSLSGPPDQGFGACKPLPAGADPKTACSASGVKPVQCPAVRSHLTPGLGSESVMPVDFSCHGCSSYAMVLSSVDREKGCHISLADKRLLWLSVGWLWVCQVGLIIQCVTLLQGNISRQQCSGTPRTPQPQPLTFR